MSYLFTVPASKRVRVIISSDTACEADDPFAIAHALLSPKLDVLAIAAEHFMSEGSMQKSLERAATVTRLMNSPVPVLPGQQWPPVEGEISAGAQCIIDAARCDDARPLYVLCMGALSTMAAALRAAPDIADRLTVVCIGGRSYGPDAPAFREFNFGNDPDAWNALIATPVTIWQIPLSGYGNMRTSLAMLQKHVAPCGEIGAWLLAQMDEYNNSPWAGWTAGESWSLGDNPSVAVVLDEFCGQSCWQNAHRIDAETAYTDELPGRLIRVFHTVNSHFVLEDLFAKLELNFR